MSPIEILTAANFALRLIQQQIADAKARHEAAKALASAEEIQKFDDELNGLSTVIADIRAEFPGAA